MRRELIERDVPAGRAGRVPVLVGITDTAIVESLGIARHAADAGASALVMAPPYYYPAGQPELVQYIERVVAELPLPLFLYNMPMMTKISVETETIRRLRDQPRIVGVKDSSGDRAYFDRLLALARQRPDWTVLTGRDT